MALCIKEITCIQVEVEPILEERLLHIQVIVVHALRLRLKIGIARTTIETNIHSPTLRQRLLHAHIRRTVIAIVVQRLTVVVVGIVAPQIHGQACVLEDVPIDVARQRRGLCASDVAVRSVADELARRVFTLSIVLSSTSDVTLEILLFVKL